MSDWKEEKIGTETYLSKSFVFKDFSEAFAFLTYVALVAEKMEHHPHIYNVYNRVDLRLTSHEAGYSLTEKDWIFAKKIDELL